MGRRARRSTSNLLLAVLLILTVPLASRADTAGSVNIRSLGATPIPSGLVDANGIKIQCVVGCSGSAAFTDNSLFTAGTSAITNVGGLFNDGVSAVTSGNAAAARITAQRGLHVNLRNVSGTELGTSGTPLRTDPTGTTAQPVSGTVAISGTVTVSGTVTATQGGSPWGMRLQDGSGATLATVTAGNALKTDGSAVTQPVSGTVTANQGGTWTVQPGNTANTTPWLMSVTSLIPGTTQTSLGKPEDGIHITGDTGVAVWTKRTDTASTSAGNDNEYATLNSDSLGRVWTRANGVVTPADGSAIPSDAIAVWSINGCYNGTSIDFCTKSTTGNGIVDAGTQRVTLASNSTGQVAVSSLPTNQTVADPCTFRAKSYAPINSSTAATTQLVAASSGNKLYVCAIHLMTNLANNVALVEDDTAACASPTAGLVGGTTAATGYPLAANGGLTLGSGSGTTMVTAATNRYVCIITSAATQLSGGMSYVLAP